MKKMFFLALLSMMFFVLAACTEETAGGEDSGGEGSGDGGDSKDSIVIGFESDAATLMANTDVNYVTDAQIRNIYEPLIERDIETKDYVPNLAESWENIDELTWRFQLKEGVTFHNGAEFNADAVKFSIDYILDESNQSFYRSRWVDIEEVTVISPYEIEITTSRPFPDLMERITEDLLIMEPGYVEDVGNDTASNEPVGTGVSIRGMVTR